jgi:putative oxidoreductase
MILIQAIASLALRIALAAPFLLEGLKTWVAPLVPVPSVADRFGGDFQLHIFDKTYPMPYPDIVGLVFAYGEVLLPAALIIGFLTRLSAFGLLVMTAVLFLSMPPTWSTDALPWAAMALGLIAYGAGRISFDDLIASSWRGR